MLTISTRLLDQQTQSGICALMMSSSSKMDLLLIINAQMPDQYTQSDIRVLIVSRIPKMDLPLTISAQMLYYIIQLRQKIMITIQTHKPRPKENSLTQTLEAKNSGMKYDTKSYNILQEVQQKNFKGFKHKMAILRLKTSVCLQNRFISYGK